MKDQYSINEILNAIEELENLKKKGSNTIIISKPVEKKNVDIPASTLGLIEEAEKQLDQS